MKINSIHIVMKSSTFTGKTSTRAIQTKVCIHHHPYIDPLSYGFRIIQQAFDSKFLVYEQEMNKLHSVIEKQQESVDWIHKRK